MRFTEGTRTNPSQTANEHKDPEKKNPQREVMRPGHGVRPKTRTAKAESLTGLNPRGEKSGTAPTSMWEEHPQGLEKKQHTACRTKIEGEFI